MSGSSVTPGGYPRRPMNLSDRILELVRRRGPLEAGELVDLLRTSLPEVFTATALDPRFFSLGTEIGPAADVLDGRCFTAPPPSGDGLPLEPDLAILRAVGPRFRARLPDGREVSCEIDYGARTVDGPDGWLHGFDDPRIAVTIVDAPGRLVEMVPCAEDPGAPDEATVARVRATLSDLGLLWDPDVGDAPPPAGTWVAHAVRVLVHDHPDLFRDPGPTLRELVRAAGFSIYRDVAVVPPEADLGRWDELIDDDPDELADYDDEEEWEELRALIPGLGPDADRLRDLAAEGPPFDVDEVAPLLDSPDARAALFGIGANFPDGLEAAAETVLASDLRHVGARCARAAVLLGRGDADGAEGELRAVCDMADDPMACERLAELRSERGDARGALALYRRAGFAEDEPDIEMLRAMASTPARAGRNEPCPCGSGRKYKRCCGNPNGAKPLPERFPWVARKVLKFAHDPRHRGAFLRWAHAFFGRADFPELDDRLVADAVLHNDRPEPAAFDPLGLSTEPDSAPEPVIRRFLRERSGRLPPDERELLERWCETRLEVVEVVDVGPGVLALRRADGGTVEVRDLAASRDLESSDVVLVRLLPDGEGLRIWTARRIPAHRRTEIEAAIDEGYVALAEAVQPLVGR